MIAFALGTALLIAEVLLSSLVKGMITETANHFALVEQLPEDAILIFHNVPWEDYEELLAQVGEARGLRTASTTGLSKL